MNLLFCRKGGVRLIQALLLIGCLGCGNVLRSHGPLQSNIPPSNVHVGEMALKSAIENSGIPEGHGAEVVLHVHEAGKAGNLLELSASEFLLSRGYSVFENKESIPEFRFSLDTLYVNLDIKRSKNEGELIQRYSEARISAVFHQTSGIREVYKSRGIHEDSFPFQMLDAAGNDESFVSFLPEHERIRGKIKPFLLGISMSALLWLLYSYRG